MLLIEIEPAYENGTKNTHTHRTHQANGAVKDEEGTSCPLKTLFIVFVVIVVIAYHPFIIIVCLFSSLIRF